ncbi:dicarboxylate/amino acid:cation symporter [Paenibacillus sp. HJGM_3]|uniref:dicarboxylate/amino acid:cation symporter n=1 Tax=Paenibacillus sp. HJGM_3 TaxID=3379816 RepID=UPI003859755B
MKAQWLKKPSVVLASILIGGAIGLFLKPVAQAIAPIGDLYMLFLKMLVIPIMATAVITSLSKLFAARSVAVNLRRMALVFLAGLAAAAVIGVIVGLIGQPGASVDHSSREVLGQTILEQESGESPEVSGKSFDFWSFFYLLIPNNIFQSLQGGDNLQILFVAIIFGAAVGKLSSERRYDVISVVEMTYKAFEKMMAWSLYGLPFGLLCMIAHEVAGMGKDLIYSMATFIALVHAACLLLMALGSVLTAAMRGTGVFTPIRQMKEPLLLAFGTRNSMMAIPSVLETLRTKFRLNEEVINLVVPLSIVICRYSLVIVFSIGTIFVSELYGVELGVQGLLLVLIGSIVAAIAGAGAPILVSLSMISLILDPLGLPSQTAVVLLLSVITIIDPILTLLNVLLAGLSTMLIEGRAQPVKTAQLSS